MLSFVVVEIKLVEGCGGAEAQWTISEKLLLIIGGDLINVEQVEEDEEEKLLSVKDDWGASSCFTRRGCNTCKTTGSAFFSSVHSV